MKQYRMLLISSIRLWYTEESKSMAVATTARGNIFANIYRSLVNRSDTTVHFMKGSGRMIKIQMTGICENCDKAKLYLWDSDQSAFTHNWHVSCENEDACRRVEILCENKTEGEEE